MPNYGFSEDEVQEAHLLHLTGRAPSGALGAFGSATGPAGGGGRFRGHRVVDLVRQQHKDR